ncbi:serine carboxypeptidase-like 50 [Aegilops tauschii subsp. strangulata]|uniref:Carboxypeptidase n=1 Tax=Aegilops tauschii subsp. strangulata TaxID=200361 RepID=A0A453NV80_AEGTS|nr:serine carboxypeptidase-like 50 [Aegilops tauschii subsp. strangulata]
MQLSVFRVQLLVLLGVAVVSASADAAFPRAALPTSSGYLPVDPSTDASLFFAFYEASASLTAPADTPLLLWLEGGPGCPGLLSNFLQLGPYSLSCRPGNGASISRNPFARNRCFGLLFLDSPLGTGFNAAPSTTDIPRSQPAIAEHVLAALESFDASPAHFRARPFFLAGDSYAGKYVPAAGSRILAAKLLFRPLLADRTTHSS